MIAVSGFSRSGTTILRDVLNTHPQFKVLYEANLFEKCPGPRGDWLASLTIKNQNEEDLDRLVNAVWRNCPDTVTFELLERVMRDEFGKVYVGDKLSSYFRYFHRHIGLHRIFIYRDPRDACASYWRAAHGPWANFQWAQVKSLAEVAQRWMESVEAAKKSTAVYCVKYEELVLDPGDVMDSLAGFLGVDNVFDTSIVHDKALGRGDLSEREVAEIVAVAKPTMDFLGYQ